jgi:hypothetical protein
MTMTTTTGPTGGRENADDFAGYVDEEDNDDPIGGSVGNLPKGYICNVPLPRVPQGQSTRQSQVLPNTIPHYYEDAFTIPMYKDTCRIEERVATANSPQWQPIAINT